MSKIAHNLRWPYLLMNPGDSFEVPEEADFNSAKCAASKAMAKHPGMILKSQVSCARCEKNLSHGGVRPQRCKCRKAPKRLLTVTRWA